MCPDGWVKRKNYCYYFSASAEKQGYGVAKCHNMSAELASIHDKEENTFVTKTLVSYLIIVLFTK